MCSQARIPLVFALGVKLMLPSGTHGLGSAYIYLQEGTHALFAHTAWSYLRGEYPIAPTFPVDGYEARNTRGPIDGMPLACFS